MNGDLLKRYTTRAGENGADADVSADAEGCDDFGAFGWLRGVQDRAVSLELRRKGGDILAIGYSWIERVQFDPSEGITLHCGKQTIRFRGRNLNSEIRPQVRLFEGICWHRVPWLVEADRPADLAAGNGGTVIERIEW
jgi:hypothetical protein